MTDQKMNLNHIVYPIYIYMKTNNQTTSNLIDLFFFSFLFSSQFLKMMLSSLSLLLYNTIYINPTELIHPKTLNITTYNTHHHWMDSIVYNWMSLQYTSYTIYINIYIYGEQLHIEFRPESFDGIILLTGERDDLTGDFMAVLIHQGFIEFW